ncbi:CBS domain-containing protein [Cephalotus follicularis]|uniref:CBS domain-containing protein n=1 Tax=Cephalotus follicularis TaxID=3775 RepID=A0A1Q3AR93_CEPFO|nr:CBS domain-containing protein [Cephalotus follicularis]
MHETEKYRSSNSKRKEEVQEARKMDLRQIENVMKGQEGGMVEEKDTPMTDQNIAEVDSGSALQQFLNHIPINSIPGIRNYPVLELKTGDSVRDAIHLLFEKNVSGAPIADVVDPDTTTGRFLDRYIGFIDLSSMVLWSLEKCKEAHAQTKGSDKDETGQSGLFSMLQQNPQIGQTKVGELAKEFLLDPFFPVSLEDTLFHILLLLSKHRLRVVPVMEQADSQLVGFVTPNAVIQLLLRSSGLEWFDSIADKAISEFRFEKEEHAVKVYGNQNMAEALQILWENRVGAVAVITQGTKRLIGSLRSNDIYLLLENDNLLNDSKRITVEEFIHIDTEKPDCDPTIDRDLGALLSAGSLRLRGGFLPRMNSPVMNKKTDTLKQAMKNLAETKSNFSYIVDDSQRLTGLLTLRDILIQFAPPCIDSSIHGGGFFESALEQSGCHVKNGAIIRDH